MTNEEKIKIHFKNYEDLTRRQAILKSQKNLTVEEIVNLFCNEVNSLDTLSEILTSDKIELSNDDKIAFCRKICNSSIQKEISSLVYIGSNEPTPAGAHSKISFIKNKYNELAFERFSKFLTNAKKDYATSFKESCENVTNGFCEFCILPITSSNDGRLMSFYSLLDVYDLKICAVTDVEDEDSAKNIRYACVGRSCHGQFEGRLQKKPLIFEFSVVDSTNDFLILLLLAAKEAQAEIINIDSFPVEYSSHLQRFYFSFRIPSQNALFFRLLTALSHQSYSPIGIYKEIHN